MRWKRERWRGGKGVAEGAKRRRQGRGRLCARTGQKLPSACALRYTYVCGCVCDVVPAAPGGFPSSLPVAYSRATPRCARQLSCPTPRRRHGCATTGGHTQEPLALSSGPSLEATYPTCQPSTRLHTLRRRPPSSTFPRAQSRRDRVLIATGVYRARRRSAAGSTFKTSYGIAKASTEPAPGSRYTRQSSELGAPTGDNHAGRGATRVSRMRPTRVTEMVE